MVIAKKKNLPKILKVGNIWEKTEDRT